MRRCASYSVHLKMRGEILLRYSDMAMEHPPTAGSWFSFWKVCKVPASVPKVSTRVVEPVSWSSLSVPGQQKRIEDIEGYCIEGDNYGNQFTVPHTFDPYLWRASGKNESLRLFERLQQAFTQCKSLTNSSQSLSSKISTTSKTFRRKRL